MSADHLSLLFSGKDSDVTITCQGHTFHVHREIICPQSAVFRAVFTGEFKESTTLHLDMAGFDLGAAMIMMKFLYGEVDVLESGFVSLVHNLEPDDDTDEPSEQLLTELALADSRKRRRSSGILTHGDLHPSWMRRHEATLIRAREIKRDLLCLVHVNKVADYYQVDELRTASHAVIEKLLEDQWDLKAFLSGAKLVSTEIGDLVVHRIFIKFAAQNMQELTEAESESELDTSGVWELHNFGPEFAKLAAAEVEDLKQKLHDAEGRLGRPQRSRLYGLQS